MFPCAIVDVTNAACFARGADKWVTLLPIASEPFNLVNGTVVPSSLHWHVSVSSGIWLLESSKWSLFELFIEKVVEK